MFFHALNVQKFVSASPFLGLIQTKFLAAPMIGRPVFGRGRRVIAMAANDIDANVSFKQFVIVMGIMQQIAMNLL